MSIGGLKAMRDSLPMGTAAAVLSSFEDKDRRAKKLHKAAYPKGIPSGGPCCLLYITHMPVGGKWCRWLQGGVADKFRSCWG